nr:MAG TPA: hypothetical protein [Microviridae sp.]
MKRSVVVVTPHTGHEFFPSSHVRVIVGQYESCKTFLPN